MTRKKNTRTNKTKEPGPFDATAQEIHDWIGTEYQAHLDQFDDRLQLIQQRAERYAAAPTQLVNAFLNGTPRHAVNEEKTDEQSSSSE